MRGRQLATLARAGLFSPSALLVLGGSCAIALLSALRLGFPGAPQGMWDSLFGDTEGNLTYGLAGAVLLGTATAAGIVQLDQWLHSAGIDPSTRITLALLGGVFSGLLIRAAIIVTEITGGVINQVFGTAGPALALPSVRELIQGQSRLLVVSVLCALLGAAISVMVRRPLAALGVSTALVLIYVPFVGGAANRVPGVLNVLPYLPFGSLRAALSGNGGIFGLDPGQERLLGAVPGALLYSLDLLLAIGIGYLITAKLPTAVPARALLPATALLLGTGTAAAAGAILPPALGGEVPWQWQPQWRSAQNAGWSSDAVAVRWADQVTTGGANSNLFASPADAQAASRIDLVPLRTTGASARAQFTDQKNAGQRIRLLVTLSPPVLTGNVSVSQIEYQLTFHVVHGQYLIDAITEPLRTKATLIPTGKAGTS